MLSTGLLTPTEGVDRRKLRSCRGDCTPPSQPQNQPQPRLDPAHESPRDLSGAIRQVPLIHRHKLRDVGDGVPGQSGAGRWQEHVAGGVEVSRVRRQGHADHRPESASVEGVGLDDEDRPAKPALGSLWLPEVGPPHFAPRDYHSAESDLA